MIDSWGCAISWIPVLTIENSQLQHQTAASVDKVANVMQSTGDEATALRAELVGRVLKSALNGPTREQLSDESHHPRLR